MRHSEECAIYIGIGIHFQAETATSMSTFNRESTVGLLRSILDVLPLLALQQLKMLTKHAQHLALVPLELPPESLLGLTGIQMRSNTRARITVCQASTLHSIRKFSHNNLVGFPPAQTTGFAGFAGGGLVAGRYARIERFDVQPGNVLFTSREAGKWCLTVNFQHRAKESPRCCRAVHLEEM